MNLTKPYARAVLVLSAFVIFACGGEKSSDPGITLPPPSPPPSPVPTTVNVTPTSISFTAFGVNQQLTAVVRDQFGAVHNSPVSWSTQNSSVATISQSGLITAVGAGTTNAIATAGNATASVAVTVQQSVASLQVSAPKSSLSAIGETVQVAAVARDASGNGIASPPITWSSSSASVASVSLTGLVTAVGNGTTEIRAVADGQTATISVFVTQAANTLNVTPQRDTLNVVGQTRQLSAVIRDSRGNVMSGNISWTSSNNSVLTVSASGMVTAIGRGSATVTAQHGALTATAQIVVDDFGDLGVGWIHRSPEMNFVTASTNATRDGWPTVGQSVTWEARVKNRSRYNRIAVPYRWTVDGIQVAAGTVDMPAGAMVTIPLARTWSFARSKLGFELDYGNAFGEVEERNNALEVFTDAISVGFYVEQTLYDYFAEHQSKLGIGSNSWEDWAQRHVKRWNTMFENAKYPLSPLGVLDRIRLDKVTIVPDGALPLAGGLASNNPNVNDRTVDLQWGFPSSVLQTDWYKNLSQLPGANNEPVNPFYYESSLLHELGHARYLVDVYGFNVLDGGWTPTGIVNKGSNIAIMEGGQLVAGSAYMPIVAWEHVYYSIFSDGLMGGDYHTIGQYNAAALNLIAGRRAILGNMNGPGNIGVFLNDLPAQNRLTITDAAGQAIPNASVKIFQAAPKANEWYGKFFDNNADLSLTTDAQGQVLLGRNPFGGSGIVHTYGHSNGVIIIRVEKNGQVGYAFFEAARLNMEFWRGHTAMGEHSLAVKLR